MTLPADLHLRLACRVIRFGCQVLPEPERGERAREWEAEVHAVACDPDRGGVLRAAAALWFALSLLLRIRETSRLVPGTGLPAELVRSLIHSDAARTGTRALAAFCGFVLFLVAVAAALLLFVGGVVVAAMEAAGVATGDGAGSGGSALAAVVTIVFLVACPIAATAGVSRWQRARQGRQ